MGMIGWRRLEWCVIVLVAIAAGCASSPEDADETKDWSAERIFKEAKSALDAGDYETAVKNFEKLEARFPFGRFAQQAQLETAYAYYKSREVESSIAACDRFIKLHPTHPAVDYAYYLRGLAAFQEGINDFEEAVGKSPDHMDVGLARRSYQYFSELQTRFPGSKYAADSLQRMVYLRNKLAQHEANVASYYLRRGVHVAALNRSKSVLVQYPQTPAVADALAVMTRAYSELKEYTLAKDSMRVWELNFPQDVRIAELKEMLARATAAPVTTETP
jgi:outer membrane protein assembly factor BamD